jgi:hypothetical protein
LEEYHASTEQHSCYANIPATMPSSPWGQVKRALSSNDYSSVSAGHSQSRPSYSSDSQQSGEDDGPLLEKEIASIRRKASLWYRYWRMIVAHLLLLIIYLGVLSALVSRSNNRCKQGPRLVTSKSQYTDISE